jgi:sigma-B regulation protein RsbU (phosphoserine phosphatase)
MSSFTYPRVRARVRSLIPTSIVGRLALYIGALRLGVFLITALLQLAGNTAAVQSLEGWANGLSWIFGILLAILLLRWIRQRFMWKLRNRLIVTYVFIGVVPVALVVTMVAIAGALFANQYASSQARAELDAEIRALDVFNRGLAAQIAERSARGEKLAIRQILDAQARHIARRFPGIELHAWRGASSSDAHVSHAANQLPDWAKPGFSGLTQDGGKLFLRSVQKEEDVTTLVSVPVSKELLDRTLSPLGQISFYLARRKATRSDRPAIAVSRQPDTGDVENVDYELTEADVVGGTVPGPSRGAWDAERAFGTVSPLRNWENGTEDVALIQLRSRPSVLMTRLFSSQGSFAAAAIALLVVVGICFALIELAAIIVGLRITRTITSSVYKLYMATQHVNRGDLQHRIHVKDRDQLAALQLSFNSMTESLARLIEEQKEKERLENELAIAQEVQATLFPRQVGDLQTLELHGICRPARTVSGDYYDFLPMSRNAHSERIGVAVGDISGKGISAALLMATLHSAVRAYEYGRMPRRDELIRAGAAAIAGVTHVGQSTGPDLLVENSSTSPAEVLHLLNRHLYFSTQPEKYATFFLGVFDGPNRLLTYSNAGHLPPIIVSPDGSVRRLEVGGMVIGLFDGMVYEESEVELRHGDVFVAFSDGITEPENEFGEFGEERLIELIRATRDLSLPRISETVLAAVQDWIGSAEQPDDVTLVLARAR